MTVFPQLEIPETLAAGPGPGNTDPRVLERFAKTGVADHMQKDVLRGMLEAKLMLRELWGTKNVYTYGVAGTGFSGLDCVLSLILPADKVGVFPNGTVAGIDSLVIIPPETDVVLGLWKVETLITGSGITKAVFLLDGKSQMPRVRPPFQAELRLSKYPTEHLIRVEGYSANGDLLASDEVVLNQQRGQLDIKVLEPRRGTEITPGPEKIRGTRIVVS